jgi:hypothetical protein
MARASVSSSFGFPIWYLGLLPIPSILLGGAIAHAHGVSAEVFGVNVIALVLGIGILGILNRYTWKELVDRALVIAIVAEALLAATILLWREGAVSRWMVVGPVRLNVSAVSMPWVLAAMAGLSILRRPALATAAIVTTQMLHFLQPDAGQATAFGLSAAVLIAATRSLGAGWRAAGSTLAMFGAAGAWFREDPLGAVSHVERILHLAAQLGAIWLLAALLAVGALVLPPAIIAVRSRLVRSEATPLAASLAVYFGLTVAVTELGNFPVPVIGAGAAPVLGWYCLIGILLLSLRADTIATTREF